MIDNCVVAANIYISFAPHLRNKSRQKFLPRLADCVSFSCRTRLISTGICCVIAVQSRINGLLELEQRVEGLMVFLSAGHEFIKEGPAVELDARCQKFGSLSLKLRNGIFSSINRVMISAKRASSASNSTVTRLPSISISRISGQDRKILIPASTLSTKRTSTMRFLRICR